MQYLGIDWAYRRPAWCSKQADGTIFGEGFVPADKRLIAELAASASRDLQRESGIAADSWLSSIPVV